MRSEELLEMLEQENPVPPADVAGARSSNEARNLLATIVALPLEPTREPRRRQRRLARFAAAAVAVGALVAVLAAVPSALLPDERLGASPAAAETLEQLAVTAAAQPPTRGGHYVYSKVRVLDLGTNTDDPPFSILFPSLRESWVGADGSGRIRETSGAPIFLSGKDRARWTSDGGRTEPRPVSDQRFGPRDHFRDDANLPSDPDALEAALRAEAATENPPPEDGYTVAGEMLQKIGDLLYSPATSLELRAALYRVMARLEGVELVGPVTDPAGRRGIALSGPAFYDDGEKARRLLIIDPETSQVLAEQTVLRQRVEWIDADPPLVIAELVFLASGWVDSIDERPSQRYRQRLSVSPGEGVVLSP